MSWINACRQRNVIRRSLPLTLTLTLALFGGARAAHSHNQDRAGETGGVAIHVSADYFSIAYISEPPETVNVGTVYGAATEVQHWGRLSLTGTQAEATAGFAAQSTGGAGHLWELHVDQEDYTIYGGWQETGSIPRDIAGAHSKSVNATTTGISQTPSGTLYVAVGDPHTVVFESIE